MTHETSLIGWTKGPGEDPQDFVFISADIQRVLKIGEFVTYKTKVDDTEREILSRITDRQPLRQYPDSFSASPEIAPNQIAQLVGYNQKDHELFQLTASVIGYFDEKVGDFINPRIAPREGGSIYIASNHMLARLLNKKELGGKGSAHVGSLLSRDIDEVPTVLDVASLVSTHMAIIASTGAGKSYLAGVLIEELTSSYNMASVLIIDPHGEYDTLSEMMNNDRFRMEKYRPDVRIFRPGQVKVKSGCT